MMPRSSSGGKVDIAAVTKKIDVDNRISLHFYFRIADNILKQADIFRGEKNIIDLYVMLLRFSSLVNETIPRHRDYRTSPQGNKIILKKKLLAAVTELEVLKPAVQEKLQELHFEKVYKLNKHQSSLQREIQESSVQWPAIRPKWNDYSTKQGVLPVASKFGYQGQKALPLPKTIDGQFHRMALSIPRPTVETLSKHSILGPNGLRGQWQPPSSYKVQYPSYVDFTAPQIPGISTIQTSVKDGTVMGEDNESSEGEKSVLESEVQPKIDKDQTQESDSLIDFESETSPQIEIIRQPSPPPILADVQDLVPQSTTAIQAENVMENMNSSDALLCSKDPLQLHISTKLMDSFMNLAKSNTNKNLETCGVLAGSLKDRKFYITALIIPKQESTSDSCQTTNEEEIFEVQDKQSLFPLGWIHTHPTQSCFMSSIDVHTHYSYQIMLPESIAIVMAPRDSSRNHGIFRLTSGGMTVIRHCPRRGFHSHDPPSDGDPIYRHCTDVYMNPSLKFDVIDLR